MSQLNRLIPDTAARPFLLPEPPLSVQPQGELVILNPGDFHQTHYGRLFSTALRILRDRDLAQDAVQESFKNIFQHLPAFRGESRLETWMTRITVNVCLGYLRKNRLRIKGEVELQEADGSAVSAEAGVPDDPLEVTYRTELRHLIRRAMGRIKEIHRQVIYLHDIKQNTLDEISARLGIPVGTIKSRLFYGRKELRAAIESLSSRQAYHLT
jgi:RNA polymerase sigma-70 factor (ECF subfamily)